MKRACTICGTPSPTSRCAKHGGNHTGWSPNRDRTAQHTFRQQLLERAGHRCEATINGTRCTATADLRACHITPLSQGGGYDLGNGALLCGTHDRATDRHAR